MGSNLETVFLPTSDPIAISLILSLRSGDTGEVASLLHDKPYLANVRLVDAVGSNDRWRTPLHVVTDWPGYFVNAPANAKLIIEAGGDPNVDCGGDHPETPLHYAASSDDVEVARVLIDGGADIERGGGSIGTPLANAVGYACFSVAQLLLERGAKVNTLWEAAGLGLTGRIEELLDGSISGKEGGFSQEDLDQALWHGCQGGSVRAVQLLLSRGANLSSKPDYVGGQSHADAVRSLGTQRQYLIELLNSIGN